MLQSFGGVMRPSSLWPVAGQGNDGYPRGALRPADGPPRAHGLKARRHGVPELPAAASALYVDYASGSDNGAGSKAAPLKTIGAAVAKAQSLPAPRTIFLTGASTHYLTETVRIKAAHSQLTITSLPGQVSRRHDNLSSGIWLAPLASLLAPSVCQHCCCRNDHPWHTALLGPLESAPALALLVRAGAGGARGGGQRRRRDQAELDGGGQHERRQGHDLHHARAPR